MTKKDVKENVTQNVTVKCINCGKEFTGKSKRAQFCSGACKIQFHRNKKKGSIVTYNRDGVTQKTGKHNTDVTITDKLFIDDAAERGLVDWYTFNKEVQDRECGWCGKVFHTRLALNLYCSPQCRDNNLNPYKGNK